MSFTSLEFLIFLLVLTVVYYCIPRRWQWILLLAASYGFYVAGGGRTVVYLVGATATTYLAGRLLGGLNAQLKALSGEEKKTRKPMLDRRKKLVVLAVCLLNFGMLFLLKYWSELAQVLRQLTGASVSAPQLLLPLGVSFFTFQSIGYVVDCYRGKTEPQKNPAKFALFLSFFPQIIQGPIARYDQLSDQLLGEHPLDWDRVKYGLQLMLWGYFKKLLLAERTGVVVNTVFSNQQAYPGSILAGAVIAYCIQLYCDFSGGIDIARGAAQMLGIDLAENFRRPIFARSLTEYWRRWHITLGSWMRDYVFYSLAFSKPFRALGSFGRRRVGGTLGKILATSTATFIVYFIIGIWHGASFRYLAYGLYNGCIITAALLMEPVFVRIRKRVPIRWDGGLWHAVQVLRTCLIVFVGRYITRAPRLTTALVMLRRTVLEFRPGALLDGTIWNLGITKADYLVIFGSLIVLFAVEGYQERGGEARKWLESRRPLWQVLLTLAAVAALLLLGVFRQGYTGAGFIYAQF